MDLLALLAATTSEEEPSKTAFYVAGLLLVGWALALSAYGLRRHKEWPPTQGARRGVVAVTALLMLTAMAAAVATS